MLPFGNMALLPLQSRVLAVRLATVSANGIPMVSIVSIEYRAACGTICPIALRDLGFSLDDGALVRRQSVEQ